MEIKHENGTVTFRMKTGRDMVRNTMPLKTAERILKKAKETKEIDGGVWADNKYLFPTVSQKRKKRESEEETEAATTAPAKEEAPKEEAKNE